MRVEDEVAALTARVADLERRLEALSAAPPAPTRPPAAGVAPPPVPGPPPISAPVPPAAGVVAYPAAPPPPGFMDPPTALRPRPAPTGPPEWANVETVLRWAGLGLVVLAAVFFVATAIARGWIGPELQLLGATAVGVAMLVGATRLVTDRRPWAVALGVGGAIVLPICAAAAHVELDLIGGGPALVLLAPVVIGVVALAWRLGMESVATVVAVVAGPAMLAVVYDAELAPLVPGLWLVATAGGASVVGLLRRWTVGRVIVVWQSGLQFMGLILDEPDLSEFERVVAVVGVIVIGLVAWVGPWLADNRAPGLVRGWRAGIDRRLVVLVPLWAWATASAAIMFTSTVAFVSVGLVGAVACAGFAVAVRARTAVSLVAAYGLAALTLALGAAAVATDGPALLVVMAAVAAAGLVLARLLDDVFGLASSLILATLTVFVSMVLLVGGLPNPVGWGTLAATALVVVLLGVGAVVFDRLNGSEAVAGTNALVVATWLGGLLWTAAAFVHGPQGQVVVSLIWAGAAIGALLVSVTLNRSVFRALGLITLGLVLTKLLTVDLASVDALWRVGLFLVVGAGLMRLGYVLPKLSADGDAQLR